MSVVPQTYVTIGKWQVFWLILADTVFPDVFKTQWFWYPVTLLVGRKIGLTASGNVADLHCVPILAPFPHGIIYKGENQMRVQSYMFFLKEIQKEEKTAVFLLFFNTKWVRSIIFVMIVWYIDAWEGRCYAFALFVPTSSAALGIAFKASLMLCSHLHEQSGRMRNSGRTDNAPLG